MIKNGQYFEAEGGRVFLAESDAKGIAGGYFEVKTANDYVSGYLDSPITVRRMFELLECPVPEGAKVCQFVNQTYGIVYWTTVLPCGGVLGPSETGWDMYSYAPSKDTFDLSDLPVTEEVIESLPEPLQEKWKELL